MNFISGILSEQRRHIFGMNSLIYPVFYYGKFNALCYLPCYFHHEIKSNRLKIILFEKFHDLMRTKKLNQSFAVNVFSVLECQQKKRAFQMTARIQTRHLLADTRTICQRKSNH